ncbi:hypothetical protein ACFQ6E_37380 [Streptomyces sp. NPDC056462]|uniref:hypothetical protein n=1 Tax=Streptomyces sp. NPDC056462 TaxID=3345826 RepID=UPI00368B333D
MARRAARDGVDVRFGAGALLAGVTMLGDALASLASAARHVPPPPVSDFRGVNWADPRDNYADEVIVIGPPVSTKRAPVAA